MAGTTLYPERIDIYGDVIAGEDIAANHVNNLRRAIEACEIKLGIDNSAVVTSIDYLLKNVASSNPGHLHEMTNGLSDCTANRDEVSRCADADYNNFFGTGRAMWFYENTAPTGWTYSSGITDRILAVKGGSQAYNVNGGTQAGSFTQPNCTLTKAQIPPHKHRYNKSIANWIFYDPEAPWPKQYSWVPTFTLDGSADGLAGDPHNHGTAYRPYAAVGIISTKDA